MDAAAHGLVLDRARPIAAARPRGVADGVRWLFLWLAVVSAALTVPGVLLGARGGLMILGPAAALMLTASWIFGYRRGSAPVGLDIVDAAALIGIALASPQPGAVVIVVFGALWFRSLYGSAWQALLRVCLYAAALGLPFGLWPLLFGTEFGIDPGIYSAVLPALFVTVAIARQLGKSLVARDQSIGRDRVLAETGAQLLGAVDPDAIIALAWDASTDLCAAAPGLRLLRVVAEGSDLRVDGTAGTFRTAPTRLAADVLFTRPGSAYARILDPAPLNAAVGTPVMWECLAFEGRDHRGWLLVGAPRRMPAEVLLSVRGLVAQVALAIRTSDAHRDLTMLARTDSLTLLDNRSSFLAGLAETIAEAGSHETQVLFLDLDDFKDVNDALGHGAGDALLVDVAARLLRCTRPTDLCARLGGDEFAVLLRDTTPEAAAAVAERMVAAIHAPFPIGGGAGGRSVRVGASIGVATAIPGVGVEGLVHRADVAMYAAKAQGKNRVEYFALGLLNADRGLAPQA
ncbi:GGDEF domain-containing protein [Cryobacterium sp. TMT1-21]|uniref:GGDEF domain-containing protein n=1 Tax=Cryobacterium shii TaxID=1259235 RepID=A0AAQ2C7S2_9MICO|nr:MULTISPECIES: GGDEF domain-containing protein [Cryobacterium]TFC50710.1 GGDEF domain-containing protein [Cryobacterium shii]TFC85763.1 GGDEF domain-containing protein [Cryobacterium sp. TmT2-59]TFD12525.1 GGDEF domain-containing protein [Cryobacterium sp. TMT4-10]TFD13284.1 GGDEF domain-containing protein [Cryobacterium sp. TMT1-21]TFD16693.1 GGDEF domain-containing protein [Cryobacterium sp. TMT2-23]